MARTAFTAPAHIIKQRAAPGNSQQQPDSAPSLAYGGMNLLDQRMQYNRFNGLGNGVAAAAVGWAGQDNVVVLDYTPPASSTTNIAAGAHVVSGTAMALVSTSGAGVTVTSSALTAMPSMNVVPSGTLAMGVQMGYLFLGTRDITAFYDPTKAWACAVSITGVSAGSGGAFTVRGADVYGFPVSETITVAAGVNTVNGKKAFKWVYSVTPGFTDPNNYSVGTTLITGLNLAADSAGYTGEWLSGTGITANQTIVAAVTTSATAITGDVRGTTILTAAAYVLTVKVSAARLTNTTLLSIGLFGVAQFTN